MNILVPMAGAGSRFVTAGYSAHKPVIPLSDRRGNGKIPMVVASVKDLPVDLTAPDTNLIFIVRDFHVADGVTEILSEHFPRARFIEVDRLTEGQAETCLLARSEIDNDQPLLIAACDNGMDVSRKAFDALSGQSSGVVFTFRQNGAVLDNPKAYGWMRVSGSTVTGVSIKQPISDTPMADHAVVGTFWFKRGSDFVRAADAMIAANDRINNEFYVDQVIGYLLSAEQPVCVLDVDRYLCWGTPDDYEEYERTLGYWDSFVEREFHR